MSLELKKYLNIAITVSMVVPKWRNLILSWGIKMNYSLLFYYKWWALSISIALNISYNTQCFP